MVNKWELITYDLIFEGDSKVVNDLFASGRMYEIDDDNDLIGGVVNALTAEGYINDDVGLEGIDVDYDGDDSIYVTFNGTPLVEFRWKGVV
jgi:hypothetical protein